MNNEDFLAWLRKNNACENAVIRVGNMSAQEVWDTWGNPSELLWWVEKSKVIGKRRLALLAAGIARNTPLADGRTIGDLLTDPHSHNVIKNAERWAGEASDEEAAIKILPMLAEPRIVVEWAERLAVKKGVTCSTKEAVFVDVVATVRTWQLAYIREQLPDFVERFTKANS